MLVDVGLAKEDAALGVEARGQEDRRRVVQALAEVGGLVRDRDRVKVDEAEDALAPLLRLDVLGDRPDVVAQVLAPGGLDAAEDAHGEECNGVSGSAAKAACAGGCIGTSGDPRSVSRVSAFRREPR